MQCGIVVVIIAHHHIHTAPGRTHRTHTPSHPEKKKPSNESKSYIIIIKIQWQFYYQTVFFFRSQQTIIKS